MEYLDYLKGKKIDPAKFETGDKELFDKLKLLYEQVHPNSFTQQKLFLINNVRRKFHLKEETKDSTKASTVKVRPRILPNKPKI